MLSKHKTDTKIQFIDASGEDFYKKGTNNNVLEEKHIDEIMQLLREEIAKIIAEIEV